MAIGTIYYLIDDVSSPKLTIEEMKRYYRRKTFLKYLYWCVFGRRRAVGGIKMDYLHCLLLQDAGYDARPLLLGKRSGNVFGYDIEPVRIDDIGYDLKESGVIVSNEYNPYNAAMFNNCRKIIFVQNWSTVDRGLRPQDKQKTYYDLGYDYVMCCSQYLANYIRQRMAINADLVCNGVDETVFFPDPAIREKGRILCLPRKNKQDIDQIRAIVEGRHPKAHFVKADGLSQDEIAREYRRSDIFLATGYPEGFSLPPMEAMASGCTVVGFTGGGASEFMLDGKTALVAEDGDCTSAANKLLSVLLDEPLKESLRAQAFQMSRKYTLECMQQQLVDFFEKLDRGSLQDEQASVA